MTEHEGLLAATFTDGGLGSGYLRGEVLVTRLRDRQLDREDWLYRPQQEVTGWVMACSCGWRGRPWARVAEPTEADVAARRAYSADGSPPRGPLEEAADEEWAAHVAAHPAGPGAAPGGLSDRTAAELGTLLEAALRDLPAVEG